MRFLNHELDILERIKGVDNPNLIKIYDLVSTESELQIFMELCTKDLKSYLVQKESLKASEILAFLNQIVSGYQTLHTRSIFHGKLEPKNILVGEDD